MKKDQSGFTLIELVVVITILGILAATALPRFLDVQDEAHDAAVEGAKGGLAAGVNLAHSKAIVEGAKSGSNIDIDDDGTTDVSVNADGWPEGSGGTSSVGDAGDCVDIWQGVMQNPPSASTSGDADYIASNPGTNPPDCQFKYQNKADGTPTIAYTASTGTVSGP